MARAKWPTHYLAVDSITGKPRSLFFTGYESFEAWEISRNHVRPGHDKDWESPVKLYQKGCEKIPDCHRAAYQSVYGLENGTYIIFNPMISAGEIDHAYGDMRTFSDTLGEDGMKKLAELSTLTLDSSETSLFIFNPRMSYASEDWIKADPDFWKPKAAMAETSKPSAKPAEKPAGQ